MSHPASSGATPGGAQSHGIRILAIHADDGHGHLSPQLYGLLFAAGIVGIMLTNLLNARYVALFGSDRLMRAGTVGAAITGLLLALDSRMDWGGLMACSFPSSCLYRRPGSSSRTPSLAPWAAPRSARAPTSLFKFSPHLSVSVRKLPASSCTMRGMRAPRLSASQTIMDHVCGPNLWLRRCANPRPVSVPADEVRSGTDAA
jgi:hypothetical protein